MNDNRMILYLVNISMWNRNPRWLPQQYKGKWHVTMFWALFWKLKLILSAQLCILFVIENHYFLLCLS